MRPISDRLIVRRRQQAGFTLVEMIISIVLVGILGAVMAGFLRVPLQGYEDIARRAAIGDQADLALRRISRDLREALPNSVRVTTIGTTTYLEFLRVRTGGRYRAEPSGGATTCPPGGLGAGFNDTLETGVTDACFLALGSLPDRALIANNADWLVLYNLGTGYVGGDAYFGGNAVVAGGNKSRLTSTAAGVGANPEDRVNFQNFAFPLASPSERFYIVSGPVTYECNLGAQAIRRYSNYTVSVLQPTPPAGGFSVLATGVTGCAFTYDPNVIAQRNGIVSLQMTIERRDAAGASPEQVSLLQQVHVSNAP